MGLHQERPAAGDARVPAACGRRRSRRARDGAAARPRPASRSRTARHRRDGSVRGRAGSPAPVDRPAARCGSRRPIRRPGTWVIHPDALTPGRVHAYGVARTPAGSGTTPVHAVRPRRPSPVGPLYARRRSRLRLSGRARPRPPSTPSGTRAPVRPMPPCSGFSHDGADERAEASAAERGCRRHGGDRVPDTPGTRRRRPRSALAARVSRSSPSPRAGSPAPRRRRFWPGPRRLAGSPASTLARLQGSSGTG